MAFPKDPIRSKGWYDNCFEGAKPEMPADLRRMSESICDRYTISGICDPMYLANVAAFELGRGDGRGTFYPMTAEARETQAQRLDTFVGRVRFAYSSNVTGSPAEVLDLVKQALAPVPA